MGFPLPVNLLQNKNILELFEFLYTLQSNIWIYDMVAKKSDPKPKLAKKSSEEDFQEKEHKKEKENKQEKK